MPLKIGGQLRPPAFQTAPILDTNQVVRTISRLLNARIAMLVTGAKADVRVLGAYGTNVERLPNTWKMQRGGDNLTHIRYERDINKAPDLVNHPLKDVVPAVKSFVAIWAPPGAVGCYCLLALDPDPKAVADCRIMECAQTMLSSLREVATERPDNDGFSEGPVPAIPRERNIQNEADPVTRFLLGTLVKQRRLHSRNHIDFVSLRRWRTPIKPYQLEALKALKAAPSTDLLATAASEIVEHSQRQFGANAFKHIIPVPCGSSGTHECLSTKIARTVADMTGATYSPVLRNAGKVKPGSSHPRKNARFPGYICDSLPDGPYLLVDDVVTTGKHIEMAASVLKASAQPMLAVAWLGMK